jgi:large subunit ribosomal protein L23
MALLDFLKRKKEVAASREPRQGREKSKKPVKKAEKVSAASARRSPKNEGGKKEAIKSEPASVKTTAGRGGFSYEAIKQPHISEKATGLAEMDQYIFEISPNYNKNEIKKAVEGLYNVDVLSVNMIKIPSKKRRLGKTEGFRKAYKKAVVRIKNGQKIEIL